MTRLRIDLTGQRFGRLTALTFLGKVKGNDSWLCRCDCGVEKRITQANLRGGYTQSCGCLRNERIRAKKITHGYTAEKLLGGKRRPEYRVWVSMIRRCTSPKEDSYKNYGAKGISVCDRWRFGENGKGGFECFIGDMGDRPSHTHSIDRIETSGNYEPGNCRWATAREQIQTRSIAVWVDWKGDRIPLSVACEREGVPYANVRQRMFQGWTLDRALTTPLRQVAKRGQRPAI